MGRLKEVRKYVNKQLAKMDDQDDALKAAGHLYGVSMSAQLLAQKRGVNAELAGIAGLLHDLYAYESGSYEDHAHKGADLAGEILRKLDIMTPEETDIICSAIYHHDDKAAIDSPMDEILKDADAMHHIYNDLSKEVKEKEVDRYRKIETELGIL
ncbi:MAG: HD domain-containing protein [Lachnospiraceae bacterium]|nr:HD domain-containing protein [Lachnospiraceae bacterium]